MHLRAKRDRQWLFVYYERSKEQESGYVFNSKIYSTVLWL